MTEEINSEPVETPEEEASIILQVTITEANTILASLQELPHKLVHELIQKLVAQAQAQLQG
jgi:hypothetical protein